ncbi:hypothetical protein THAOC_02221, partial [Thalassiosira oceanica]
VPRAIKKKGSRHHGQTKISNLTKLLCGPIYPPVRTVPVGVGAAHVAPLMRGDLAGPQMKQSGAASTRAAGFVLPRAPDGLGLIPARVLCGNRVHHRCVHQGDSLGLETTAAPPGGARRDTNAKQSADVFSRPPASNSL